MSDETLSFEQAKANPPGPAQPGGGLGEQGVLDEYQQTLLDTALLESDQLLARSLHDDEARRRKRRVWFATCIAGGVAMSALLIAIVMGWLTLGVAQDTSAQNRSTQADAKGDAEPTLAELRKAEQLSAQGWQLWQNRKMLEAEAKFKEAVALDPAAANAWNGLGWARFNSGQAENAEEAFQNCLELEAKHPAALNGLGQIAFMYQEYEDAERYLAKAAKQNATAAWWGLAKTYLLTGEYAKARRWAAKIVKQSPDAPGAQEMLDAAKAKELSDELRSTIEPRGKRRRPKGKEAAAEDIVDGQATDTEAASD
ncbi:MAG: tetratricopeptide repeat protein [Planctomycetota bacterium]